jgi:CHAT domain-containing protein
VSNQRHFGGHLILANREMLLVEHIAATTNLTARLVVLAACRSGAAALGPAAVISLPAMLMAAGASAVLGTLWHADELATLLLVRRFYQLWQAGRAQPATVALGHALEWLASSTAEDLRAACPAAALANPTAGAALARAGLTDRPYSHPWYWASFFLVGEC